MEILVVEVLDTLYWFISLFICSTRALSRYRYFGQTLMSLGWRSESATISLDICLLKPVINSLRHSKFIWKKPKNVNFLMSDGFTPITIETVRTQIISATLKYSHLFTRWYLISLELYVANKDLSNCNYMRIQNWH